MLITILLKLSKNRRASGNIQLATKELLRTTSKVLLRATQ
jgi:hypothetical protein